MNGPLIRIHGSFTEAELSRRQGDLFRGTFRLWPPQGTEDVRVRPTEHVKDLYVGEMRDQSGSSRGRSNGT